MPVLREQGVDYRYIQQLQRGYIFTCVCGVLHTLPLFSNENIWTFGELYKEHEQQTVLTIFFQSLVGEGAPKRTYRLVLADILEASACTEPGTMYSNI